MKSLEGQVVENTYARVKTWSNENLLSVWRAARSSAAHPEDGYGTFVGETWIVLEWDEWMNILYSEIERRELPAT